MSVTFKTVYFFGLVAEMLIRLPHERRRRQTQMVVDRVSALERLLIALVSVGLLFIPAVYVFTSWLDWADYRLSLRGTRRVGGVGAAVLAMAVWVFWRSHTDLGRNWSPSLQIREGHTLVTEGVYGSIRHPMYASIWLWGMAQTLLLQNWVAGWASIVLFLPMYVLRVPHEEQMMVEQFGEAYLAYMNRTGRVVPRLRGQGA
jgi:protein-S-isoprenylcysteine O-methyltransferase Ste14